MDAAILVLNIVSMAVLIVALAVALRPRAAADIAPVRDDVRTSAAALRHELSVQRGELAATLDRHQQALGGQLVAASGAQTDRAARDRTARAQSDAQLRQDLRETQGAVTQRLDGLAAALASRQQEFREAVDAQLTALRQENDAKLEKIRQTVDDRLQGTLKTALAENAEQIQRLSRANTDKHIELQNVLRSELDKLRAGNEQKLEKMRETVDEKLQGTLERRLGESFALVSERLEQVQKGLGEMQSLASDVGGLKRVLTNVKTRGSWGEVQLARQLEDILTASQYDENVAIRPGDTERVEFAVRLPGRDDDGTPVYLPIDSKLPQEDYERLLGAQEAGDKADVDAVGRDLERVVVEQAKKISQKYIQPPYSTDFAIMYLPTEGLFAEIVRRPGLADRLQREQRVLVTGPTTLMSLLNSLQVGFRSVAIEKRSSEVWQVLAAAKAEFQKYGAVWQKLEKQLATAQNTVTEAGRRTRAVERRLRAVEAADVEAPEDGGVGVLDAPVGQVEAPEDDGLGLLDAPAAQAEAPEDDGVGVLDAPVGQAEVPESSTPPVVTTPPVATP